MTIQTLPDCKTIADVEQLPLTERIACIAADLDPIIKNNAFFSEDRNMIVLADGRYVAQKVIEFPERVADALKAFSLGGLPFKTPSIASYDWKIIGMANDTDPHGEVTKRINKVISDVPDGDMSRIFEAVAEYERQRINQDAGLEAVMKIEGIAGPGGMGN